MNVEPSEWTTSRYNFAIDAGDSAIAYNAASGAALRMRGPDARLLAARLAAKPSNFLADEVPEETLGHLLREGFLVRAGTDEVAAVRERYRRARIETPMVVTITTTMDCNLGCYYCYEERTQDALAAQDADSIVDLATRRLKSSGRSALHVDWYGGEPLLNVAFLEHASLRLQEACRTLNVRYSASIISNGTEWPQDVAAFVARHRIRQTQISFDGMKRNHDRRRRFRSDGDSDDGRSSFDLATDLVDRLLECVRVDVRLNIDRGNEEDIEPFIEFIRARGWFRRPFPAVVQPARLASFSAHSSFMRKHELSVEEYDEVRNRVRQAVGDCGPVEECETPDGFPYPRTSVCAALANDSVVVGADRRLYRCGLQVGEHGRSVGRIGGCASEGSPFELPIVESTADVSFWDSFDPTRSPKCSRCSFLPICWGGCPKKHLEGDVTAIDEQGEFWRKNLARLVAARFGLSPPAEFSFDLADQFRCESAS